MSPGPDKGHRHLERDIRIWNLHSPRNDGQQRAEHDEQAERQLAGPGGPVEQQEGEAVDGGHDEREERARDKCLPAEPAEPEANAHRELDVFPELSCRS